MTKHFVMSEAQRVHLLDIREVSAVFGDGRRTVLALDRVSFRIDESQIVGLVGESGCGKTTLALAVMQLLPHEGRILQGEILFRGDNLLSLSDTQIACIRGQLLAMVTQNTLGALNPAFTAGEQIASVARRNRGISRVAAKALALEMLRLVELLPAERWSQRMPHQLSGGMRQRLLFARALACDPVLLLADEPTTGLDVRLQLRLLSILRDRRAGAGRSVLLITHDLRALRPVADRIVVMCGGQVVEDAPAAAFYVGAKHPYSLALIAAANRLSGIRTSRYIAATFNMQRPSRAGCPFVGRCREALERCYAERPSLHEVASNWRVACFLQHDEVIKASDVKVSATSDELKS